MRSELDKIVKDTWYGANYGVDVFLLRKNTCRWSHKDVANLDWSRVVKLYIVGPGSLPKPENVNNTGDLSRGCYVDESGAWVLLAGPTEQFAQHCLDCCGKKLEVLHVRGVDIRELSLGDLSGLTSLTVLGSPKIQKLSGMEQLCALRRIRFVEVGIAGKLVLDMFPALIELKLTYTGITNIRLSRELPGLQSVFLQDTPIHDMEFLKFCPALRFIRLWSVPLSVIPEEMRELKKLEYVSFVRMQLEELPDWLPELKLRFGTTFSGEFCFCETRIKDIDMSIFDQTQEAILAWFEERKNARLTEEGVALNELKVVFLGDGEVGKSLTVARLLNNGAYPENFSDFATPGIAIADREYDLPDGRHVQIHFWDFGGQEILHSMHRMFLTERTLYVVMINARDDTQDDRARYWLHNIKSFAGNCPVLLVLNKVDQNPNASINKRDLCKLYPELKKVIRLSALTYDQETFNAAFTDPMLEEIGSIDSLGTFFPKSWQQLKQRLRTMEEPYIRGAEYNRISEECGVEGEELRRDLLNWFSDLGVSFCYRGSARLEDYVILRPEWITNAVYTILWNKRPNANNGMIKQEEIYSLLNPTETQREMIRQMNPDLRYDLDEISYLLNVIRKFRLSFSVKNETEFIPMICQRNALAITDSYEKAEDALEFRLEYEYLPNNVLHRLMVDLRQDLDTKNVWLTGARFAQKSNGVSALVKSEGNIMYIYVRSKKQQCRPDIYLNIIRDALEDIHKDMGLAEPETLVAYKQDGKVDCFPYEMLVGAQESGQRSQYSMVFKRQIPIGQILKQTDSEVEKQKKKLLADIAACCIQMQSRELFWKASENVRNDQLRDALRNMRYQVSDQSRRGVGGGEKQAGEVDLLILRENNLPWTVIETLNIHSDNKKDMDNWDAHLHKLLDNYNSEGLSMLILVSYVECSGNEYPKWLSAYSEHMCWHDPEGVERRKGTYEMVSHLAEQTNYLQVARCTYDRAGMPTTVYHYFMRIGR